MNNKYDKYVFYKKVLLALLIITIITAMISFFYKYALIISVTTFVTSKIINTKMKGLKKE